jgi:ribosomal protein S21
VTRRREETYEEPENKRVAKKIIARKIILVII